MNRFWGCFEARQSLATGGEGVGTPRRRAVCGRRGPAGEGTTFGRSRRLQVSLRPSAARWPEPPAGARTERRGDATPAKECGARSSGLASQSPPGAPEPAPTGRGVQGEGQARAQPPGQAPKRKAILVTAPRSAELSGFLFGEKNRQNPARQKGEEGRAAWRGLAGLAAARAPLPRPHRAPLPGPGPPPASGKGAGPAGCARPSTCREGGGRAGWGLFVTLLPRSPRSPGSGLRRSLPLAAAASAGAICCCRFWRSAIQKQTSSMTTNSYSQMY